MAQGPQIPALKMTMQNANASYILGVHLSLVLISPGVFSVVKKEYESQSCDRQWFERRPRTGLRRAQKRRSRAPRMRTQKIPQQTVNNVKKLGIADYSTTLKRDWKS